MFESSRTFEKVDAEHSLSSLRLAPLIDIVFLLLIFFMVSTTFTVQPGLRIELPGSGGEVEVPEDRRVISLTHQGEVYLNDEQVELDGLRGRLEAEEIPVIVRADRRVPHGRLVDVLDLIRETGVRKVNLSTRPLEEKQDE